MSELHFGKRQISSAINGCSRAAALLLPLLAFLLVPQTLSQPVQESGETTRVELSKLPEESRAVLTRHAKHFARLNDGTLIDRQNEIEFRRVNESAWKASKRIASMGAEPQFVFQIPATPERTAWGITSAGGEIVEPPPMWTSGPKAAKVDVVLVGGRGAQASFATIDQVVGDGRALVTIHWRSQIGDGGRQSVLQLIPGSFADGGQLHDPFYALRSTPSTHTFETALGTTRTVPMYSYHSADLQPVSPQALAEAIQSGEARLSQWKFVRAKLRPRDTADHARPPEYEWVHRVIAVKGIETKSDNPE